MSFVCANDFAPKDGFTVFYKQPGRVKSDGFVAVLGGHVLTIDGGREEDTGVFDYLLALRREWLKDRPELIDDANVKLTISMLLTHGHRDHFPAVWNIVRHPFVRVDRVWYPPRAAMADGGTIPLLTFYENQYRTLRKELPNARFTELTFGEHISCPFGAGKLDLYAPPLDWTEGECYEIICRENEKIKNEEAVSNGTLNNNSIWGKLTVCGKAILFTGDQRDTPLAIDSIIDHHGAEQFQCDVLKYIHHGAQRYSQRLIDVARAEIAVFSTPACGINPQAVEACAEYGDVYCLDDGDLFLTLNGDGIVARGIEPLKKKN